MDIIFCSSLKSFSIGENIGIHFFTEFFPQSVAYFYFSFPPLSLSYNYKYISKTKIKLLIMYYKYYIHWFVSERID